MKSSNPLWSLRHILAPPDDILLEVRDVTARYGHVVALRGVSYVIGPGQIVCLLGGNASGKSTSMKAIYGTVEVTAGSVFWLGENVDNRSTSWRVQAGISAVPEGRRVFASLDVNENLLTGAATRRDPKGVKEDLSKVYDLFPQLHTLRDRQAGKLSGGEQQMVAFGRALMARPRLVCMDEPSMGLAPKLVLQTMERIEALRSSGTSVFLVEQNANAALSVADYAYVIRQGEIVLEGTAGTVAAHPMMKEAYLGAASTHRSKEREPMEEGL